jgi:hypothetical protein
MFVLFSQYNKEGKQLPKKKGVKLTLKEKYKMLRDAGFNSKEAMKLRNRSVENVQKEIKKQSAKNNYRTLRELGFSPKDANRFRNASPVTIDRITKTKELPAKTWGRKRRKEELVIMWTDKTEMTDATHLQKMKAMHRGLTDKELIERINVMKDEQMGEIGAVVMEVTEDADRYIESNSYYHLAYRGQAQNYHKLLVAVSALLHLIYDAFEKSMFLYDVAQEVSKLHPENAERLVYDLDIM